MLNGMSTPPEKPAGQAPVKGLQFVSLGFEMVAPIVLLMYVGYRLDMWLGSKPWLFLVGALLGIAVGFYGMFKRVGILGNRDGESQ
jgi:ATP synthase protein I